MSASDSKTDVIIDEIICRDGIEVPTSSQAVDVVSQGTEKRKKKKQSPTKRGKFKSSVHDMVNSVDDGNKNKPKQVKKRKQASNKDYEEIEVMLQGLGQDKFDNVLEEAAEKNNLTEKRVQILLREVVRDKNVLAMVQNTIKAEEGEEEDLEEAVYEPKLTRSKVKELREKQHVLPWLVTTPVKQTENLMSKKLLEEEFPEESSSDEDYKPAEEEGNSDEEENLASPKSSDLSCIRENTPLSSAVPEPKDIEEESELVIDITDSTTEPDKIALRTRSKLPLNDTPLESIEASFIAPDITVDMYDTECDDVEWQKFLCELTQPLDAQENVAEQDDDDPEYNILDDVNEEDDDDKQNWEFRNDKAVKVTRKELDELLAEIYESFKDCKDEEEYEDEQRFTPMLEIQPYSYSQLIIMGRDMSNWMSYEGKAQLEEQMRMHVQLLAQSFLLSFGVEELSFMNVSTKLLLEELKMFATRERMSEEIKSAFDAHNLDGALNIIKEYESSEIKPSPKVTTKHHQSIESKHVKQTLVSSKVFIYPELLPVCSYHRSYRSGMKAVFTAAEDYLIALGLEEFSYLRNPVPCIQNLLLPPKTEHQIKIRIKNCKSQKTAQESPIKYFYEHDVAPPVQRVIRIFDPNNVKCPKQLFADVLPKWMRPYSSCRPLKPIAPAGVDPSKLVAVVHPTVRNSPDKRKLNPILPRGQHLSPLKQISPILRKYQHRRTANIMPFKSKSSNRKNIGFASRHYSKPPLIKPKPTSNANSETNVNSVFVNKITPSAIVLRSAANEKDSKSLGIPESEAEALASEGSRANKKTGSQKPDDSEVVEEADEVGDDEQDLAALMAASSTICKKPNPVNKKRNKLQRDLESSLALLQPNIIESDPKKQEREVLFANSYLLRVTEALKTEPETLEKFLNTLCRYQCSTRSSLKLFEEVNEILHNHSDLVNDFAAFLKPEQAKACGKYMEYTTLYKIRQFLRKLEMHFQNQPQHLMKILRALSQLQQTNITSTEVIRNLQPLLKNQSLLLEELNELFPDNQPPEYAVERSGCLQ